MPRVTLDNVSIRGVVCAVPGKKLSVREIAGFFPEEEIGKVASSAGIEALYRAKPGQTSADLCSMAATHLLRLLRWEPETIEGLILFTQTPDYIMPNSASVIHSRLGLSKSCFAFDVNMGCSAFVYGLWMASQFISGHVAKRILLLVGDTLSQVVSPQDRSSILFGDAGSATALEWDPNTRPSSFVLKSDGSGIKDLIIPAGGFRTRGENLPNVRMLGSDGNYRSPYELYMNGWEVFNFTIREVPELAIETLSQNKWQLDDVDLFLLHQPNKMILQHLIRKLGIPADKAPINIGRYGNTSGVSIPLLIVDDVKDKLMTSAKNVLLLGFGVGYAWAGAALTLNSIKVLDLINPSFD